MNIRTKVLMTLMILILFVGFSGSSGQTEEKQGGILERFGRMLGAGPSLRDFLPKAGAIAKYEGIIVYKDGTSSKMKEAIYFDWRHEKGKEYFVRTSKKEETKAFGIGGSSLTESTLVMEVISDQLKVVSLKERTRGTLRLGNSVCEAKDSPRSLLLGWPFVEGKKWDREFHVTCESERKMPTPGEPLKVTISYVVTGEEIIYSPAGKFHVWRVESEAARVKGSAWWAKGRWMVKWERNYEALLSESADLVEFKEHER